MLIMLWDAMVPIPGICLEVVCRLVHMKTPDGLECNPVIVWLYLEIGYEGIVM